MTIRMKASLIFLAGLVLTLLSFFYFYNTLQLDIQSIEDQRNKDRAAFAEARKAADAEAAKQRDAEIKRYEEESKASIEQQKKEIEDKYKSRVGDRYAEIMKDLELSNLRPKGVELPKLGNSNNVMTGEFGPDKHSEEIKRLESNFKGTIMYHVLIAVFLIITEIIMLIVLPRSANEQH
ncbi:hypothetical protein ACFQI7_27925 [Paenibacillus allorhizosphaerae]|uniref:Uncharacterized protein n=1 Tax=Paenibacillus allorhizosphaerae TaxID=2849866 RepID=A0ABM8VNS9_9BACL|nr:hypothetical protein [Paenibacillus allorhizosphaerae]CAG7651689.1 hypothetical protein PAECIP111802_05026 [Paenibacillus allorhizosphaerae]